MRRPLILTVLFLLGALAAACTEDDPGPGAGGPDDDSELVWMPRDAGIPPRQDAGPPTDAGVRECFDYPAVPASLLPRCTAATRDCVSACPEGMTGEACRNGCWNGDPTPRSGAPDDVGCPDCIFRQLISCVDAADCHAEVSAWLCCIVDN